MSVLSATGSGKTQVALKLETPSAGTVSLSTLPVEATKAQRREHFYFQFPVLGVALQISASSCSASYEEEEKAFFK